MIKNKKSHHLINYVMVFLMLVSGSVAAKAPAAGTIIKNQATATYKDSAGIQQTATSNLVETVIQQVSAFELTQDLQSRFGIAGQQTTFPHVLTNTGNGEDSFVLSVANLGADNFDFTDITIYADQNQDGIADNLTPITNTGTLAADEAFYFVVKATAPLAQTEAHTAKLTVTGTSEFPGGVTKTNTDTVVITDKAVIEVTKSMSAESGYADTDTYTVTLTYNNPSTTEAKNVTLIDELPDGLVYVAGSGEWSVTGAGTPLTDDGVDSQGTTQTVSYCAYDSACPAGASQVTAVVASVVPGDSGTISFQVKIAAGQNASVLLNTGQFSYNNSDIDIPEQNTNQVPLQVLAQSLVIANASATDSASADDIVDVASAGLGATVAFENVIWNLGNSIDTFDISMDETYVDGMSFPEGTTFALYHSDGFTPLLDTDNSSVVDTGPLDPNTNFVVVLKATLPMTASTGDNSGNGYSITKTATSALDPNVSDSVTDRLGTIVGSSVNLTNVAPLNGDGAKGEGIGPETDAQSKLIIAPGGSGVFVLYVNNTSTIADSFDLTFSSTVTPAYAPGTVPANWRVAFHADAGAGNCSTLGPVISNTATIAGGGNKLVCAKITLPTDTAFSNTEVSIYFRALSALTDAQDIKHDSVYMTADHQLVLEPNHRSQVEPGNSVIYTHQLNNPGNTAFTGITFNSVDSLETEGWTSVLYEDTNDNGKLDADDKPVGTYSLDPSKSMLIFAKVFAPANTPYNTTNITDISASGTTDAGSSVVVPVSVQDMTIVAKSNMKIVKLQAPDINCDGAVDPGKSYGLDAFGAQPGTCVLYQLTATNASAEASHNVRINDSIPEFTGHSKAGNLPSMSIPSGTIIQEPSEGGSGLIIGNAGVVESGESVTLVFGVRID